MSSENILNYNLSFFDNVKKQSSFKISDDTIKLLQELSDKLTILNKNNTYLDKKNIIKKNHNQDIWNNSKTFKATTFVKKEGLEKNINAIRINLNKITNKNYNILSVKILEEINNIENKTPETFNIIKNLLIDTASNIKIYSEIYVMIYKNIIENYDKNLFDINENFNILKKNITDNKIIDIKNDYNEFCNYNKENEKKRNLCLFFINLMKHNLFSGNEIIDLILDVQIYNLDLIKTNNNNIIIDELCEIIYVLITESLENIYKNNKYSTIYDNVLLITNLEKSENNSLTSKSKFKHMDILDFINKFKN